MDELNVGLFHCIARGGVGVEDLLSSGADPNAERNGVPILLHACRDGVCVAALLDAGAHLSCSIVRAAMCLGHYAVVHTLMRYGGASLSDDAESLLSESILLNRADFTALLLSCGAVVQSDDVTRAVYHNNSVALKHLLPHAGHLGATLCACLETAAWLNNTTMCADLVAAGVGVDGEMGEVGEAGEGTTPLLVAVGNRSVEAVRVLVGLGADVMLRDAGGVTPVVAAASIGNDASLALLIACGAPLEDTNPAGQTALQLAVAEGHDSAARLLIAAGALPREGCWLPEGEEEGR